MSLPLKPAPSRATGLQSNGCGEKGQESRPVSGWLARGQGGQELLTSVHFSAPTSLGWLPEAKAPAPHWGQTPSALSQRGAKNSGWLSLMPDLSREARERSRLPSPPAPTLPGCAPSEPDQAAACCSIPSLCKATCGCLTLLSLKPWYPPHFYLFLS